MLVPGQEGDRGSGQCFLCQNNTKVFLETSIQERFFLKIMKVHNFQSELTDVSAKKGSTGSSIRHLNVSYVVKPHALLAKFAGRTLILITLLVEAADPCF